MLQYTDHLGSNWHVMIRAARLVPETGTAALPPPFGVLETTPINDLARFGLTTHPLQQQYPGLQVLHHALVVPKAFKVERNRQRGVALYFDFNGSGYAACIASGQGRNLIAPWAWEDSTSGSATDPAATVGLEYRTVDGILWQNFLAHGSFGDGENGLDWLDGVPADLKTMYDRRNGRVLQYIFAGKEIPNIGIAEQTLRSGDVRSTLSFLVYFPKPEYAGKKLMTPPTYGGGYRAMRGTRGGGDLTLESFSLGGAATTRGGLDEMVTEKLVAGGEIKQHVRRGPFGPGFFNEQPSVLFVLYPMNEAIAAQVTQTTRIPGRQQF